MKVRSFILGLILPLNLLAQINYKECQVLQVNAQDTTQKHISLIQKYDNNGNLIYEKYQGYKTDFQNGKRDGEFHYKWENNLLIEKVFVEKSRIGEGFDSTRTVLSYDENRLIMEQRYKQLSKVKRDFNRHLPQYPDDYFPKKWYLVGEKSFKYDKNERLIEEYAPEIYYSTQNRYKYEYDEAGRLVTELSMEHDKLIWKKNINTRIVRKLL